MPNVQKFGSSAFRAFLFCLIVGLLVENFILVRQNRRLKSPEFIEEVRSGQRLENLEGATLDGRIRPIRLPAAPSQRLVMFTFSPNCHFCQATQPIWAELSKDLQQRGIDALWVSRGTVDATKDYCEHAQIPLSSVVADPPNGSFVQLGLRAVPNTIVIGPGGLVEKVWSGALDRNASRAIFSYFGISETPPSLAGAVSVVGASPITKCCDGLGPKN